MLCCPGGELKDHIFLPIQKRSHCPCWQNVSEFPISYHGDNVVKCGPGGAPVLI